MPSRPELASPTPGAIPLRGRQNLPLGEMSRTCDVGHRAQPPLSATSPCMGVSIVSTSLVDECYRRAQEAKRAAEMASTPSQMTHFLDLEQRWLRAAESVAAKIPIPIAQPKIAAPDLDQPSQGTQEKDVVVPRRADEIGDEQARSANLTLTMQYRGLERTIPLRLSNEDIRKLALEAEFREISLGQLVGMLIEAAMAQDLSRVLDKKPAEERE